MRMLIVEDIMKGPQFMLVLYRGTKYPVLRIAPHWQTLRSRAPVNRPKKTQHHGFCFDNQGTESLFTFGLKFNCLGLEGRTKLFGMDRTCNHVKLDSKQKLSKCW